ncbi:cytochrome P450 [Thalassobacillus pellis]|uniref:cytochrome P450 n=1 Tax=Thalassobacillus pellis TaxID=748008 RepID=UPI00195F5D5D|nr:cytochrome P450 [Thalassobacillus pellis]MBM7554564.1 cytochrome P450 [Thalassobacillus pellis]
MKPSDFPRDRRFRTPGPAFIEHGVAHLRSYTDVQRAMKDNQEDEFSQDSSFWMPPNERVHLVFHFMWSKGRKKADGSPGRHDTLRRIIESWFRRKAVKTMERKVQEQTSILIRTIIEKGTGEFNLATELAYRLSIRTICSLIGLPLEREEWMRQHLEAFAKTPSFAQVHREPEEVEEYFWEVIHARIQHPQEELLDVLIGAWKQQKITDLELLGYLWGAFSAGTDSTGVNITNFFCLLAEFDLLEEARRRLDDPTWWNRAGEEVLRFCTSFAAAPTLAIKDVVLESGLRIPAMTPVSLWLSAANRDEKVNGGNPHATHPNFFDIHRSPNHHLTFGSGIHYCLGAQLARLEMRIALQTALRFLPELTFDDTKPFHRYAGLADGVSEAPFRFNQRKAEQHLDQLQASFIC